MRESIRARRAVALLLVLVVALAAVPGIAAAETRMGGTVVVDEGETVNGDLQVTAGTVIVRGTVTGNLQGVAGTVVVDGTVEGNVQVAAGSFTLSEGATVGGDLQVGAGDAVVDGTVEGNAEIGAEAIRIGDTAVIDGDLRYDGDLEQAPGATVGGEVVRDSSLGFDFGVSVAPWTVSLYWFVVNLALAAVLLAVFPRFTGGVADRVRGEPAKSAGVGVLALVGVPVALVLLTITIVGIPLALLGVFVYLVALWVGAVLGRYAVGEWLLTYTDVENRWLGLLAGFVVVAVATRIPFVGWLVELAVVLLGLGAVALALARSFRARREGESPVTDERPESGTRDDSDRQTPA
jgi:cytoskeletal protein CcmA (bactofilin family)